MREPLDLNDTSTRFRQWLVANTMGMRFESLARALQRKFNPEQPRVPAGEPEGGQWTSDDSRNSSFEDEPILVGGRSEHFCWNQLTIDLLYCGSLQPPWWATACRSQAMERYSACITGKPLPPLPF